MTAVDVSAIGRSNVERRTPDVQSKRDRRGLIQRFSYAFASGAGVFPTNGRGWVAFTILKARIIPSSPPESSTGVALSFRSQDPKTLLIPSARGDAGAATIGDLHLRAALSEPENSGVHRPHPRSDNGQRFEPRLRALTRCIQT